MRDAEGGNADNFEVAAVKARSKEVDRAAVCDVDLSTGLENISCPWVILKAGNRQKNSTRVSVGTRGTATCADAKTREVRSSKGQAERCVRFLGLPRKQLRAEKTKLRGKGEQFQYKGMLSAAEEATAIEMRRELLELRAPSQRYIVEMNVACEAARVCGTSLLVSVTKKLPANCFRVGSATFVHEADSACGHEGACVTQT